MDVSIIFWLVIGAITIAALYFRSRVGEKKSELMQAFVEKSQPIPPELLVEGRLPYDPRSFMIGGIILIGVGVATVIFFWTMSSGLFGESEAPLWLPFLGAFPLCIGGACLATARYLRRHE